MVLGFGSKRKKVSTETESSSYDPHEEEPETPPHNPRDEITQAPGYPNIWLYTDPMRERFSDLVTKPVIGTKFFDHFLLRQLGIEGQMRNFYRGMGILGLFSMLEYTYQDLTLEFFSTFQFQESTTPQAVNFMLCGTPHCMTLNEFRNMLGCGEGRELSAPRRFEHAVLWLCMTNERLPSRFKGARVGRIHHPTLRMGHRILAGTFGGKTETGPVNKGELELMGSHLNVQADDPFELDTGRLMARRFVKIGKGGPTLSAIPCGGIVTFIAKYRLRNAFTELDRTPVDRERCLSYDLLSSRHGWLRRDQGGQYEWQVRDHHFIPLPFDAIPVVQQTPMSEVQAPPTSYLLPLGGVTPRIVPERPHGYQFPFGGDSQGASSSHFQGASSSQSQGVPTYTEAPSSSQMPNSSQFQGTQCQGAGPSFQGAQQYPTPPFF